MQHRIRPFVDAAKFSGVMTFGAFLGCFVRSDGALAILGCATACQCAAMLAAAFAVSPGAQAWNGARIEALSLPSYSASAVAFGIFLHRGIDARHAIDLVLLGGFFTVQGRLFATHIAAKLCHVHEPLRQSVLASKTRPLI